MLDRPIQTTDAPCLDERALAQALSGRHYIGGRLAPACSGRTFAVVNPATGTEVGRAAEGDAADVDAAVADADRAQKAWARMPARKRGALVAQCAAVLRDHVEELARLIALETGKALRTESRVEAQVVADIFEFYGGLGSELKGESVPFAPDVLSVTVREPLGVVGAIIPWNVPMLLMALKVAPALVAGNTVVVKSAEEAPLTVLRVCELLGRVLPAGCFNILSGFGPECGAPLVEHPKVRKVTFTGSVEVGRIVSQAAARKLIPVTLELGGKSSMLVFADCDFDKTVMGAVTSMRFTRQGQSCTAASRIYVRAAPPWTRMFLFCAGALAMPVSFSRNFFIDSLSASCSYFKASRMYSSRDVFSEDLVRPLHAGATGYCMLNCGAPEMRAITLIDW